MHEEGGEVVTNNRKLESRQTTRERRLLHPGWRTERRPGWCLSRLGLVSLAAWNSPAGPSALAFSRSKWGDGTMHLTSHCGGAAVLCGALFATGLQGFKVVRECSRWWRWRQRTNTQGTVRAGGKDVCQGTVCCARRMSLVGAEVGTVRTGRVMSRTQGEINDEALVCGEGVGLRWMIRL